MGNSTVNQSRTAVMLRRYARSMMRPADFLKHPRMARALYQWVKKWWTNLTTKQRGEVGHRLKAGQLPLPKHFVGAPAMGGRVRMSPGGPIVDAPVPASRVARRKADSKKLRKAKNRVADKKAAGKVGE